MVIRSDRVTPSALVQRAILPALASRSSVAVTPSTSWRRRWKFFVASMNSSGEIEGDARGRTAEQGRNHSDLEAKKCEECDKGENERGNVECRHDRNLNDHPERVLFVHLAEERVKGEPDREVEDHADDGGGDRRQRRTECLVTAQR